MLNWKKIAAGIAAVAVVGSFGGCTIGNSTATALTIDGMKVPAGVYIYYSYAAYSEAISTLSEQDSELDTTDDDAVKALKLDNKSVETWIYDKTIEYCQKYVATEKQFEDLGLELETSETNEIDETIDSFWESNGETYENNGISEESIRKVLQNSYKTDDVFLYYYGIDGEKGTTEEDVHDYYVENDARVRYIQIDMKDGNGDLLKDSDKAELKNMVEDYLGRIEAVQDDEEAMLAEFDAVETDYDAYVTSISEEAAAETATSETDEDGNEIATTTTETTTETTTVAETEEEDSEETTVVADDADAETTTTAEEETEEETTTVAEEEETSEDETTTTTDPYANETIIEKITTDEDADEDSDDEDEDVTYTPCEKVYNYVFDEAKLGVPAIVEDEEAYYLVVRLDIEERMTEDDLWTEDAKNSVVADMFNDDYDADQESWTSAQTLEVNKKAVKKFDIFEMEF